MGQQRVHIPIAIAIITWNWLWHILGFWITIKIITWSMVQQRVHLRITIAIIQWFSYRNKIHNVEYALEAVVDLYAKWMRVRFVCMLGPKFTDSLCEEGFWTMICHCSAIDLPLGYACEILFFNLDLPLICLWVALVRIRFWTMICRWSAFGLRLWGSKKKRTRKKLKTKQRHFYQIWCHESLVQKMCRPF